MASAIRGQQLSADLVEQADPRSSVSTMDACVILAAARSVGQVPLGQPVVTQLYPRTLPAPMARTETIALLPVIEARNDMVMLRWRVL